MKKLICFNCIPLLLSSCSIRGSYYVINKSNSEISIQIRYKQYDDWEQETEQIKIQENRDEKIKFSTYKKMTKHQITVDQITNEIIFTLPSNHIAYVGMGTNTHFTNIDELRIIDSEGVVEIREEKVVIKSSKKGYVGIYTYD